MDNTLKTIDAILARFKDLIGADFNRYKNHVCRVYLNCVMMDTDASNNEKYAIAASFHDIGIWTNQTFDYLAPSEHQAKQYLSENKREEWIEEIRAMIHFHHKVTRYRGPDERTVDIFRKADWIDVSLGLVKFGQSSRTIAETKKRFPNLGFHSFLLKESSKNFLKHPLRPLPMFRI